MLKYITIDSDKKVREVVEAITAIGFLPAPRQDIQVGDLLTEYEQMICGVIPWDDNLVPAEPVAPDPTISIDVPADLSST